MPFITTNEMLQKAQRERYAVGAFNIENMEMAQAVIEAAAEARSPVILQTTPSTVRYGGIFLYHAMARVLAEQAPVPAALHLDHGDSFELALEAVKTGYTSIMIDGSAMSFEDNITVTAAVVSAAQSSGVPVEAELGKVGGKEDDHDGGAGGYTDPAAAAEFVERTKISSLAVAIGTAHGVYVEKPILDVERLEKIHGVVDIPLVLHGASGLSEQQIRDCIARGICKVNFATELRVAYSKGVKEYLRDNPDAFDPKSYGKAGREEVKRLVLKLMRICGCEGKA